MQMTYVILPSTYIPVSTKILEKLMSKFAESNVPVTEEFKEHNQRHSLSKVDLDLYHEELDVAEKVIRVKRFSMPNKGEKWKIFEDNKAMFILEGTKLTNKERDFLRTPDGFNFLIAQYKLGIKSFNSLRTELKKNLK